MVEAVTQERIYWPFAAAGFAFDAKREKLMSARTLSDGIGERIIMSSIKAYYTPEQLVGKKIIVIANLKPNRICNINSCGMSLTLFIIT